MADENKNSEGTVKKGFFAGFISKITDSNLTKKELLIPLLILILISDAVGCFIINKGKQILSSIGIGSSVDIDNLITEGNKPRANSLLEKRNYDFSLAEMLIKLRDAEKQLEMINKSGILENTDGVVPVGGQIDPDKVDAKINAAKKFRDDGINSLETFNTVISYLLGDYNYSKYYIDTFKLDCFTTSAWVIFDYAIQSAIDKYNANNNSDYMIIGYDLNDYTISVTLKNGTVYDNIELDKSLVNIIDIKNGANLDDNTIKDLYNKLADVLGSNYEIINDKIKKESVLLNKPADVIELLYAKILQSKMMDENTTKYTSGDKTGLVFASLKAPETSKSQKTSKPVLVNSYKWDGNKADEKSGEIIKIVDPKGNIFKYSIYEDGNLIPEGFILNDGRCKTLKKNA